jgi:hypothetical protein
MLKNLIAYTMHLHERYTRMGTTCFIHFILRVILIKSLTKSLRLYLFYFEAFIKIWTYRSIQQVYFVVSFIYFNSIYVQY